MNFQEDGAEGPGEDLEEVKIHEVESEGEDEQDEDENGEGGKDAMPIEPPDVQMEVGPVAEDSQLDFPLPSEVESQATCLYGQGQGGTPEVQGDIAEHGGCEGDGAEPSPSETHSLIILEDTPEKGEVNVMDEDVKRMVGTREEIEDKISELTGKLVSARKRRASETFGW